MLGILLSQAIKDNGFKSKDVILTLNNSSVIYRELYLPRIEAKRLALIVRSEMMEVLNLTPDYIMDFVVLDESVSDEGKPMVRVLAVASPSLAIRSYLELIKQTKLRLKCIDTATNSVLKFVELTPELRSLEQFILVDIGTSQLRLYLFDEGKYVLTRNTRLTMIGQATDTDAVYFIEDHINKMIQYSYTRGNKSGIKKIVLAGNEEFMESLCSRVEEDLLVPCESLKKPDFVSMSNTFSPNSLNAIGALLRK